MLPVAQAACYTAASAAGHCHNPKALRGECSVQTEFLSQLAELAVSWQRAWCLLRRSSQAMAAAGLGR